MRCKICNNTFRTPPPKMRKTQICTSCSKTDFSTRNEVKTGSSAVKWTLEKKDTTNTNNPFSSNYENKNYHGLREQQIKVNNNLIQINNEIEALTKKEQIIQNIIKDLEIQRQKENEKNTLSRFINKISKKNNEQIRDLDRLLSEKVLELEKIYSELNEKRNVQNIYKIKETKFFDKIERLEKNKNIEDSLSTKKPVSTYEDPIDRILDATEKVNAEYWDNKKEDWVHKSDIEIINDWITYSLILIRNKPLGVYQSDIMRFLSLSKIEMEDLIPRLLRIEDVYDKEIVLNGEIVDRVFRSNKIKSKIIENTSNEKLVQDNNNALEIPRPLTDVEKIRSEIKEIEMQVLERYESRERRKEQATEIENITYEMVQNYIHRKNYIDKKLKLELINSYQKHKSLSKMYDAYPNLTREKIRRHLITDSRIPSKLKELENSGGLHPNLMCSITIALYATDYFNWDGKKEDEGKIVDLAKSISKYLKSDDYINQIFQGRK
jgi:hypothetical protein